jgi:putative sigma-54 modulation protein
MEVIITGRHTDLNDSLKDYVNEKILKLNKYTNKIIDIKTVFEIEGYRYICELIVNMKSKNMVVKEEAGNFEEVFDIALDKMQKQLRRYWDKKKHHDKK